MTRWSAILRCLGARADTDFGARNSRHDSFASISIPCAQIRGRRLSLIAVPAPRFATTR